MSNESDIAKIVDLLSNNNENKTFIGTDNLKAVFCIGKGIILEKYHIFELNQSEGADNISKDILFQQMKKVIVDTAELRTKQVSEKAFEKMKEFYPDHQCNIFVW